MANVLEAMKKHQAETAVATKQQPEGAERVAEGPPAHRPDRSPEPAKAAKVAHAVGKADYAGVLLAHHDRGNPITEEYRALRTSLLAQSPNGELCFLVTSSDPDEGKTVTCLNLGLVLTERGDRRTVVVDCDLRKGTMARLLRAPGSPGMAEVLRGTASLRDVVQPTLYSSLFFIAAGQTGDGEAGELVGRPEMEEIVGELRRQYDHVIIDTPPINRLADAGTIGRSTGEALLVVRMNKTHQESVETAIRLLHAANVKLSGLVLTHQKYHLPRYVYQYS